MSVSLHKQFDEHPILEPHFRQELVIRLLGELRRGPRSFATLVEAAEGAYPIDVQTVLDELRTQQKVAISESGDWRGVDGPAQEGLSQNCYGRQSGPKDGLPEPHPLDFDWRFTAQTLSDLTNSLELSSSTRVAVLGAPTLYRHLTDIGTKSTLFDRNASLLERLRNDGYASVRDCNFLEFPQLESGFDCALADPPWYTEHYEAFIEAARCLLVPSGRLFLSVLPRLTRPSAAEDRIEILDVAQSLGFDLTAVAPRALRYVSPPFETEALKADGVIELGDWRSGDLFSFVLGTRPPKHIKPREPISKEVWQAYEVGKTTIKIKTEPAEVSQEFKFEAVSSGGEFRLRSVSRRSPARSKVNLWTSRNIALAVSKVVVLAEVLQRISGTESIHDALGSVSYEYQLTDAEREKLKDLLQLLFQDAGLEWTW